MHRTYLYVSALLVLLAITITVVGAQRDSSAAKPEAVTETAARPTAVVSRKQPDGQRRSVPAAPGTPTIPGTPATSSTRVPTPPQGIPAIKPTLPGSIPAFTTADVLAFVTAYPHPDRDPSKPPPVVTSAEFLTSSEVSARLNVSTGQPPGALLCLVTSQGSFRVAGPAGAIRTGTVGYQVFDASTGNLLLEGVGP
jgi:hypothetical protein